MSKIGVFPPNHLYVAPRELGGVLVEEPTRGAFQSGVIKPPWKTSERPTKSLYWAAKTDTLMNEEVSSVVKSVECDAHNWLRDEMKIFAGNLSDETTEDDLRQAFETFGEVKSVTLVTDKGEDKPRRFAFITMPLANEAKKAIEKMNGKDLRGQKISVEKSRTNAKARNSRRKRRSSVVGGRADGGRGGNSGGRRGRRRR